MEFHDRLYQLRREKGLSQEELAEVVGVTRQAVQKWESGASRPDMDNLTALARYFGVTLDWLITGESAPGQAEGDSACPPADREPVGQTIINHYYSRWEYEYRSKRTLWGLPLVHVHLCERGFARARGIVAVGNVATGVVSVGIFSFGLLSLGVISLGLLLSIGALAAGGLAIGGFAAGGIAVGGIVWGWLAAGGLAAGVYATGGVATASRIAVGGVAQAPLAIGSAVEGAKTIGITPGQGVDEATKAAIREAVSQSLGGRMGWLEGLLCWMAK